MGFHFVSLKVTFASQEWAQTLLESCVMSMMSKLVSWHLFEFGGKKNKISKYFVSATINNKVHLFYCKMLEMDTIYNPISFESILGIEHRK